MAEVVLLPSSFAAQSLRSRMPHLVDASSSSTAVSPEVVTAKIPFAAVVTVILVVATATFVIPAGNEHTASQRGG